jgi:hypothetical protein
MIIKQLDRGEAKTDTYRFNFIVERTYNQRMMMTHSHLDSGSEDNYFLMLISLIYVVFMTFRFMTYHFIKFLALIRFHQITKADGITFLILIGRGFCSSFYVALSMKIGEYLSVSISCHQFVSP